MRILMMAAILWLYSCKVSDTKLIGHYKAKSYHRSSIIIDSSHQFRFWNDGLEFMLNKESVFCTQGTWTRTKGNTLFLNSIEDSIAIPRLKIAKQKIASSDKSRFVFLNLDKDTVQIYEVNKNDESIFWRSHGPYLTSFENSVAKSDTLSFTFRWGFKPVKIVIDDNNANEYIVTLNPEFRPNYFRNAEFKIRRNKLIRPSDKTKFSKAKSNGI